ncbi:hypothetical protein SDC9_81150 [bioreactor metagenome]|uniref:Uncharacterized protein n=1 Tax=bioreactor metagenome TaxID=1076179 RepID=A0A644Z9C3_9ZZZZ
MRFSIEQRVFSFQFSAEKDILGYGHVRHLVQLLINTGYTEVHCLMRSEGGKRFLVKEYLSAIGGMGACKYFDQGRLARPVLTNQTMNLTHPDVHAYFIQSKNAGIALGYHSKLQEMSILVHLSLLFEEAKLHYQ